MNYLIDTNVISELVSIKPREAVVSWFETIPAQALFLSVLTIGEIRKGIEKIAAVKRKEKLLLWFENDLLKLFEGRVLSVSIEVADRWGRLQHQTKRTLPAIDSLLAATALHYDMSLVTRNVSDFSDCPGLVIINPWHHDC